MCFLRKAEDLLVLCAGLMDRKVSQERSSDNVSGSRAGCDQVAAEGAVRHSFTDFCDNKRGQQSIFLPAHLPVNVAVRQAPMERRQRRPVQFCQRCCLHR